MGEENISFDPAVLSRFDSIFIISDQAEEKKDTKVAKHVVSVHRWDVKDDTSTLPIEFLKRYIIYCQKKCAPRLTEETAEMLKCRYVAMRAVIPDPDTGQRSCIPISIRQFESLIR